MADDPPCCTADGHSITVPNKYSWPCKAQQILPAGLHPLSQLQLVKNGREHAKIGSCTGHFANNFEKRNQMSGP